MNPVSSSGREKLRVMVFHQRLKVVLIDRKLRNKHNKEELSKKEKSKCGDLYYIYFSLRELYCDSYFFFYFWVLLLSEY